MLDIHALPPRHIATLDTATGATGLQRSGSRAGGARCLDFDPEVFQLFVTHGAGGAAHHGISVWDVHNAAQGPDGLMRIVLPFAHPGGVTQLRWFDQQRTLVSMGKDRTVKVWDFPSLMTTQASNEVLGFQPQMSEQQYAQQLNSAPSEPYTQPPAVAGHGYAGGSSGYAG